MSRNVVADAGLRTGAKVSGLTVQDIVTDLDLDLRPGRRIGLVGPSSADVTAVLTTVAGLRQSVRGQPIQGTIMVDDRVIGGSPLPSRVGFLGVDHRLIPTLTAVENLLVTMLAAGEPANVASTRRAEQQLESLSLAPATWHNLVEQLSGGQQQRVGLARALVLRPTLLILDQPTSELDPDSVAMVDAILNDVQAGGSAVLLSSDDDVILAGCAEVITLGQAR